MENNTFFKCWPSCLPPCLVTKGRCPCRIRNRVGPLKPFVVEISKREDPFPDDESPVLADTNRHSKFNGETNPYFQGDEVCFESDGGSRLNGHSHSTFLPNGDCAKSVPVDQHELERISIGEEPESSLTQGFYEFLSTVFLQLSKSKQLRVIHIRSKAIEHSIVQSLAADKDSGSKSNSEDEDEDYWFTKWSRRPRLKNTFQPKVKIKGQRREMKNEPSPDLNFRTAQSSEPIQVEEEDNEESLKERLRRTCSNPNFPFDKEFSSSPPPSPKVHSDNHRNSAECHLNTKPSDNYDTVWPTDNFQPDLDPNAETGPHESSPSSFTNFGFQLEPEDSGLPLPESHLQEEGRLQLQNESHKTETGNILGRDDNQSNGNFTPPPLSLPNEPPKPLKCNGFLRSMSSPSDLEILERNGHVSPAPSKSETPPASDNPKPLLFFIHGISGSSDVWKSQFKFFHELGYEIVAPDLLGHGMSSTPDKAKHYLFESLVQDLVAVFDHFAGESRISVIIGHGYGACMGNVLSRLRSQNISLLISVSGGGPTPLIPFGCLERSLLPIRFNIFRKKKSIGRFDNPDLRHVLPKSIHQHILDGQLWVDGDAAFHRRISVPTLLVYGMRDTVVSLIEECEMERTIPKAFLELLPTAGHMVMWDEPQKFNRMLMKFIQVYTN